MTERFKSDSDQQNSHFQSESGQIQCIGSTVLSLQPSGQAAWWNRRGRMTLSGTWLTLTSENMSRRSWLAVVRPKWNRMSCLALVTCLLSTRSTLQCTHTAGHFNALYVNCGLFSVVRQNLFNQKPWCHKETARCSVFFLRPMTLWFGRMSKINTGAGWPR